ncbi:MAG: hypothetical protein QW514_07950 [Thermoprotei archaeon]
MPTYMQEREESVSPKVILFAVIVIVVTVLGFALYMRAARLGQTQYIITKGVPPIFNQIRLLPTVIQQEPLSGFTLYNLSGGFNTTSYQLDNGVAKVFPFLENNYDPNTAYVVSNITLQYSTLDVVIVKPGGNMILALNHANTTLLDAICQNSFANPQYTYCGHLGNTPYMVYYQPNTVDGTTQYSYTVLAWSNTTIVVVHYQSTLDVSVVQLKQMVSLLLKQEV